MYVLESNAQCIITGHTSPVNSCAQLAVALYSTTSIYRPQANA